MAGIVLAAGAGSRFGTPKALVVDDGGSWLARAVAILVAAGCSPVFVVLGASADDAARLLPDGPPVVRVVAERWTEGLGASLRAGLDAALAALDPLTWPPTEPDHGPAGGDWPPSAVLVTLVDLPWLDDEACRRVVAPPIGPDVLRRAVYGGAPGHPVLIGRDHWVPLRNRLAGDRGAGPYLTAHGAEGVDCSGLGGDRDVDTPLV